MPIYEYICEACKKQQEIMHKISDPIPLECEFCKAKNSLKKTISASSFQLKGSGWYKDLYSSPKPPTSPSKAS